MNPHNRSHLYVLLSFTIAAIAVTWPLAVRLTDGIPYGGDAFQYIWNGWWFSKALGDGNLSIWWTPYQYAPHGTSLSLHDLSPLNAYIQAKLTVLVGDFASHNLLILFHYVLGAWGAYILAWYLTGNRTGSVVAGVIYGFSVHHAMHLSQLSTVSSGWLPLSIYYLIKYTRDGGWRDGLLAVLMLLAAALSHWYQLAFAGVMFFGLMLIGQVGLKDEFGGLRRWARALQPWLVAVLILSPLILDAWWDAKALGTDWQVEMGRRYYVDPAWMILPPPDHPILGALVKPLEPTIPGNATEGVASLGIVAILLGFLSWFRRDRTTRAWCWLGLVIFLLSLGPTVSFLGGELGIPGPFRVWSMVPGLNLVRVPARFVGPFTLALGVCSACWIASLGSRWMTGRARNALLWGLPVLIILETIVVPLPISGSEYRHPALERVQEIYAEATGDANPPDLAINFPIVPLPRHYLLQQTMHEIPTFDCELSYPPGEAMDFSLDSWRYPELYWTPEFMEFLGVDLVLFHPREAELVYGSGIHIDAGATRRFSEWAGQDVGTQEFFKELMGYETVYEDEDLVMFVP